MKYMPILKTFFTAAVMLMTGACATTSQNDLEGTNDPWEGMNRATYKFNKAVDKAVYKPVTTVYQAVVPKVPRQGVSNAMRNLRAPWVFVNDLLQFKFKRAGTTLSRFLVDSTIGIGGLFKPSEKMGIPFHSEDLGQTLATWGIGDGPYFIIPFVGPSNGRDAIGFGTYIFADPVTIGISKLNVKGLNLTRTAVDALDFRSRTNKIVNSTYDDPDGYELMRSAYRQSRRYEVHDGSPPDEDGDLFDDLEDEEDEEEDSDENIPDES